MFYAGIEKENVVKKLNDAFGELISWDENEDLKSGVCLLCDRMLHANKIKWLKEEKLKECKRLFVPIKKIDEKVLNCYECVGEGHSKYMDRLALSPRGRYDRKKKSFAICDDCYGPCCSKPMKRPYFSLANNWMFGDAPEELTCLSDMELAIVARSRISGHIFSFYGGQHKSLRGLHSLYDVNTAHLMGSVEHMEQLGFPTIIACVLNGPFTKFQKDKVNKKIASIDRTKVMRALRWLRENNAAHKDITDEEIAKIPKPIIVDSSADCDSGHVDIETTDCASFAFPDGSNFHANGGFDSCSQLKRAVHQLRQEGHMFTLTSTSTDYIFREYESYTFQRSFPLQFPCGTGGRHDTREEKAGKNSQCTLEQYLEYLVDRARPCFQMSEFLLILCNIKLRERALRFSGFHVNCKNWSELFVENVCLLEPDELTRALENAINGMEGSGARADELVRTLKAVCKALPHTNDAARDARSSVYSMSVKYGQPAVFFTMSPDDSHNLRTQVYFNAPLDMLDEIDTLSDSDLTKRNIRRVEFRLRYPGYGSYDFENSANAVIEAVFGWNIAKGESYEEGGFFGKTIAFVGAVEEQGRKSLHIHFAIFLDKWNEIMDKYGNAEINEETQRDIQQQLAMWFEKIGSTELMPDDYQHRCKVKNYCDARSSQKNGKEIS